MQEPIRSVRFFTCKESVVVANRSICFIIGFLESCMCFQSARNCITVVDAPIIETVITRSRVFVYFLQSECDKLLELNGVTHAFPLARHRCMRSFDFSLQTLQYMRFLSCGNIRPHPLHRPLSDRLSRYSAFSCASYTYFMVFPPSFSSPGIASI